MNTPLDLPPSDREIAPATRAALLAIAAPSGHFDELRGHRSADGDSAGTALSAPWTRFFDYLGQEGFDDLNRRTSNLRRQVRDNGVTYNVYADADGPQRPWSLDLFPLIVTSESWREIEHGVLQRMRLLEAILNDVYGSQELLQANLLPPALVHGHQGYLRPMHGVAVPGGRRLHIAAFDLARAPDGHWWVMTQRTQAPSGLGYLLENRLIVSRLFPQAFLGLKVQRLAATYRALLQSLTKLTPCDAEPRIVLLTPGPYNETYFEHAYLARYLGLTLVEGSDLTVRDERLYLKTLKGLEPVHGLLKRLDDEFLDPLELRADSHLGVPGLLQAIRAGNVFVANAPGSGFLESTALLGFLPAVSQHLLKEELRLPSLPTWWCGDRAAMKAALPRLFGSVIKSTYAGPGAGAVFGQKLTPRERDDWAARIATNPDAFTLQAHLPLSQMPTWRSLPEGDRLFPRSAVLRVFAVSDGSEGWRVLPGGLTRIASTTPENASMQRGGSSADTWVMTDGEVDKTSLLVHEHPAAAPHRIRPVTSRAGENLFWLGRYTERTENSARLCRVILETLNGEDESPSTLLEWLHDMAVNNTLVSSFVPSPVNSRSIFERSLVASMGNPHGATSVGFNLAALGAAASAVRDRLSREQWKVITTAEREFLTACQGGQHQSEYSSAEALRLLETLSVHTAAITGAQTDRMTRDDGWRLLSIGRHLERLSFLAQALASAISTKAVFEDGGFEAVIALFDSTITFHALYQQRRDLPALLDLVVLDRDNPRSLAWVAQTLRGRHDRLASNSGDCFAIAAPIPDPRDWNLDLLCRRDSDGRFAELLACLAACSESAYAFSDFLTARYFAHSSESGLSLGA